jgi:hypothetical protein
MAKIGKRGGLARTDAKKQAARVNGKLGGRPERKANAVSQTKSRQLFADG